MTTHQATAINLHMSEERPAPAVQNPPAATARDRVDERYQEYHYCGYTVRISPSLVGYHWSIQNSERVAYASESCRTIKDAEKMAEGIVHLLADRSAVYVPDFQEMNRK